MDDKDFWEQFLKNSNDPPDESKSSAGRSLDPDYRTTATEQTKDKTKFTIEAIIADIRKQAASESRTGSSVANRAVTPPNSTPPSNATVDDKQAMQEMTAAMRELTDELRQFRAQMEERPYDVASYPRGRPEILENSSYLSDGLDASSADSSSETYFSDFDSSKPEQNPNENKKGNKAVSVISNILFYVVVVAIVLGAFLLRSTGKGRPFMLAGYSMANVLTSSMEDVYPKGSLIITKSVDAKELKVGDDITFMVNENTSFTHRIIGITENYQGTGERAFETKGTMNKNPDKEMVAAANVVGKVVFHSKALGSIANFMKANWIFVIFVLVVIIALIFVLKRIFREESPPQKAERPDNINVNMENN